MDVVIRYGQIDWRPQHKDPAGFSCEFSENQVGLHWDLVGTFLVRNGREIIVDPVPEVDEQLLRLPVIGVAFAVLLQQRGRLVFHGSAISISGRAAIFIGDKGQGKSTISAALHREGHGFVADDVTAVDLHPARVAMVLSSFANIKLWPDSVAALGEDPESMPRIASVTEKRDLPFRGEISGESSKLRCIYVLGCGPTPTIERLQPRDAVIALIRNLYSARFGSTLPAHLQALNFSQCTEIVKSWPVYRLYRTGDLKELPKVVELIENHFSDSLHITV